MSSLDDTRKLLQDLVAPELREIRGEIQALRAETRAGDAELRGEIKGSVAELRTEMAELRSEVKQDISELRGEVTELRGDIRRLEVKMDSQYIALINALTIDKRLTMLEQAQVAHAASTPKHS